MRTLDERYTPAMTITEQAEADAYFEGLVTEYTEAYAMSREKAEEIAKHDLAYFTGYYDNETRARVERLFGARTRTPRAKKAGVKA